MSNKHPLLLWSKSSIVALNNGRNVQYERQYIKLTRIKSVIRVIYTHHAPHLHDFLTNFCLKKTFDRVQNDSTNDQYCVKRAILNNKRIIPLSFLCD